MELQRATPSSGLQTASDAQLDHSETEEQHVAVQQHGPVHAAAAATPEPADATQSAQQPHQAAHDAAPPPKTDAAAQQPGPEAAAPKPDAAVSVTLDLSASPDAPPPAQRQPTAEAIRQRSGHIDIPAHPQQPLAAANPKRHAMAPASPPSTARPCSLSDADELPPSATPEPADAPQPQQPPDPTAKQPSELDQQQPDGPEQADRKQQDGREDAQGGVQRRQGSHHELDSEQPEAEQTQQQSEQPAASAAPAHRRNTPYICQVDGCGRNLAKEKEYYRRYRVCKSHAGAQEVVLGGDAKRYCQQCSVFHPLGDFDGDKRSCRARLSWHNNKRRKKVVAEGEAPAAAAGSGALAPRVTRATLATKEKPADDDSMLRSSGRVAARRVSSEITDSDAGDGLQWGAVRGRRGGAAPAAARTGQVLPAAGALPWGPTDGAQQRLAAAAAAGAAAAAAAAPPLLLGSQYAQQLQASSSLLAAAQAYAAGQRNAVDPGALAAHLGLPTSQVPPSWSALAALQSLDSPADAALRQAQMQHLAQLQASQAAAEAAAAREAAAAQAQAAAQAAAVAKLRDMPQQQRMQDPRAATSLINVVRAAFERQQQQQQQQQQQGISNAATAHIAEDRDTDHASSSAFQPYRPTAVRAGPGSDATAAAGGYASKPLTIAGPRAAFGANSSPPKDGSADWKARLLQRFHSAHADAAEEA